MKRLSEITCFVFDMDGTINLGDTLIPGAHELIETLRARGTKFFFFTNNSSKSPQEYVAKLARLGFCGMGREHVITSGDVMIHELKKTFGTSPRVYLVGTPALAHQFAGEGICLCGREDDVDAVVVGFDTTLDYAKLDAACALIADGAPFLATNIDRVCPLEGGAFMPDCGSICKLITHATGVEPKFVGKPFGETVEYILQKAGTQPALTAIVGDRLYTDIATAVNGGIVGIAVLSGEITQADIDASDIRPDYTFASVADIDRLLREG